MEKTQYTSDLTITQYDKIAIYLPKKKKTAPITIDRHRLLNAMMYQLKNGCVWADLPKDFPKYKTVFHYFTLWKNEGIWDRILDALKIEERISVEKNSADCPSRRLTSRKKYGFSGD